MKIGDYLQTKEAAIFLGITPNTLRSWCRSGKLPVHRHPMNGYRLFKKTDLEAVLAAIAASSRTDPSVDVPDSSR
jgi:MerR family transcriptional regulator, copper efflux regulator